MLKMSFLGLLVPFAGHGTKILKMSLLGVSWGYLRAKARRCSKTFFWVSPVAICWARHEGAQNQPSGGFLGPFGGQGSEMFKINLLGATWGHLGLLEQFGGQGTKMLKMSFLEASWSYLAARA